MLENNDTYLKKIVSNSENTTDPATLFFSPNLSQKERP
jgi:hypothetical protein